MLVGTPPFETKSLGRTYARIAANEYDIPERLSPTAKTFIATLLHPEPKMRGHLHQPGHPTDLLSQSFFASGYWPRKLPISAATQPPVFQLNDILNDNVDMTDHGGKGFNANHVSNVNVVNSVNKSRTSLIRQKFSQMFSSSNNHVQTQQQQQQSLPPPPQYQQHHHHHQLQVQYVQQQQQPQVVADQLIFQVIECLENWVAKRPLPMTHLNQFTNPLSAVPLFVSKWIDYSNKYGFGYQLSDKTVGVLFNEGTRICQSSTTAIMESNPDTSGSDGCCYEFTDARSKSVVWHSSSPPPGIDLGPRLKLLDYFGRYMDENLAEGVVASLTANQIRISTRHRSAIPQVVRWTRTASAVIMELNNGSVQVNFIRDHAKVVFWGMGETGTGSEFETGNSNQNNNLFITYMASDKTPMTYNLRLLPRLMVTSADSPLFVIDQKISQSLEVLRDLAENLNNQQQLSD